MRIGTYLTSEDITLFATVLGLFPFAGEARSREGDKENGRVDNS